MNKNKYQNKSPKDLTIGEISDILTEIAKYEYNIESPLIDAGFETRDVHRFLKEHNIEYNKSTTCLATRIETNKPITRNLINRINTAEKIVENITKNAPKSVKSEISKSSGP